MDLSIQRELLVTLSIFSTWGERGNEIFKYFDSNLAFYPFLSVDFKPCEIQRKHEILIGDKSMKNYFFPKVQEFCINGKRGVGFKKEIKLIYFLTLAGDLGMSFEEIAYHINEEHDFAGLMLIHDRVKQLIIRVKNNFSLWSST